MLDLFKQIVTFHVFFALCYAVFMLDLKLIVTFQVLFICTVMQYYVGL